MNPSTQKSALAPAKSALTESGDQAALLKPASVSRTNVSNATSTSEVLSGVLGPSIQRSLRASADLAQSKQQPSTFSEWYLKLMSKGWTATVTGFISAWCAATPIAMVVGNWCARSMRNDIITTTACWLAPTVAWHISYQTLTFAREDLKPLLAKPHGQRFAYFKSVLPKYLKISLAIESSWLAMLTASELALTKVTGNSIGQVAGYANFLANLPFNLVVVPLLQMGLRGEFKKSASEGAKALAWTVKKYSLGLVGSIFLRAQNAQKS